MKQRPSSVHRAPKRRQAVEEPPAKNPFRVVIAVHRPRFRRRAERAVQFENWDVTVLLNKEDAVGACQRGPRPPDILIISDDFGRQKTLAIFRAVQHLRSSGLKIVGLVEDCEKAPDEFPDAVPSRLCDVCVIAPYKTAALQDIFVNIFERIRGSAARKLLQNKVTAGSMPEDEDDDDEG